MTPVTDSCSNCDDIDIVTDLHRCICENIKTIATAVHNCNCDNVNTIVTVLHSCTFKASSDIVTAVHIFKCGINNKGFLFKLTVLTFGFSKHISPTLGTKIHPHIFVAEKIMRNLFENIQTCQGLSLIHI